MKKILGLVACLFILNFAIGQNEKGTAFFTSKANIDNTEGVYIFQFNANHCDKEEITKAASYYTDFFKVTSVEEDGLHKCMVTMNKVERDYKHIMKRFFVSLNIRDFSYNKKMYTLDPFFDEIILEEK